MKPFIHDDFLLQSDRARTLYHEYAADMPIIDYHCHLPPADIARDRQFANITEIWLDGDHYKWRAMRANGIDERYCTGDAPADEKFAKWAETVPRTLRNPLYHWTHLELARYFGIADRLLSPATAEGVWAETAEQLARPSHSCRGLLRSSRVRLVCTTDDPVDDLEAHRLIAEDESFDIQVLPAWRPDKGMAVEDAETFNGWVDRLGRAADVDIGDFASYMDALRRRHEFFHGRGCRLSDHGIETAYGDDVPASEAAEIFARVRAGKALDADAVRRFKSAMLYEFGVMDHEKNWTQQFHIGAMRNNSTRMFGTLGPDTGFDSIGDQALARPMSAMLDRLDRENRLARTIVYNLNPADNELMATLVGNFQDGSIPGKMQLGSGWWFLDQKDGMERQLEALSNMGLLALFVGMLTDSRSFLSYPRHEYFRRILCNVLGDDLERGLLPDDLPTIGAMVQDICYNNAAGYFGFDLPEA